MDIKEYLRDVLGAGDYEILDGIVSGISEDSVDVDIDEDVTVEGVRLRAVADDQMTGIILVPTKGSQVVFAKVRGLPEYVLLKHSGLDKVIVKVAQSISANCPEVILEADNITVRAKDVKLDAEQTTINGGSNKGLAKVESIASRMNLVENDINALKSVFGAWVVSPMDGGAALKGAAGSWASSALATTTPAQLENTKVKH